MASKKCSRHTCERKRNQDYLGQDGSRRKWSGRDSQSPNHAELCGVTFILKEHWKDWLMDWCSKGITVTNSWQLADGTVVMPFTETERDPGFEECVEVLQMGRRNGIFKRRIRQMKTLRSSSYHYDKFVPMKIKAKVKVAMPEMKPWKYLIN